MRTKSLGIALYFLVGYGILGDFSRAFSASSLQELEAPTKIIRLTIPVSWQVTRAHIKSSGATTLTESYRESWILEQRPDGLWLQSSKVRVPVYVTTPVKTPQTLPSIVVLSEADFARLIGLPRIIMNSGGEVTQVEKLSDRLVSLNLSRTAKGGVDVIINLSDDEHYAVQFDLDYSATF